MNILGEEKKKYYRIFLVTRDNLEQAVQELGYDSIEDFENTTGVSRFEILRTWVVTYKTSEFTREELLKMGYRPGVGRLVITEEDRVFIEPRPCWKSLIKKEGWITERVYESLF